MRSQAKAVPRLKGRESPDDRRVTARDSGSADSTVVVSEHGGARRSGPSEGRSSAPRARRARERDVACRADSLLDCLHAQISRGDSMGASVLSSGYALATERFGRDTPKAGGSRGGARSSSWTRAWSASTLRVEGEWRRVRSFGAGRRCSGDGVDVMATSWSNQSNRYLDETSRGRASTTESFLPRRPAPPHQRLRVLPRRIRLHVAVVGQLRVPLGDHPLHRIVHAPVHRRPEQRL
jgi:hypothetical protein